MGNIVLSIRTLVFVINEYFENLLMMNDIKNNTWVTVNKDFWVTSEAICQ